MLYLSAVTCWNPLLISQKDESEGATDAVMHVRMEVGDCAAVSYQIKVAPLNFVGDTPSFP